MKSIDTEDLRLRSASVLASMDELLRKIGPDVERLGRLSVESNLILQELLRREPPTTPTLVDGKTLPEPPKIQAS